MAKGRVIAPEEEDQYPPGGSIGTIWTLTNGKVAFSPDDPNHLPPECEPSGFAFYELEPSEVEVLKGEDDRNV